MLIVREYLNVFFDDLPGLPPKHDIKFCINLVPYTRPISIPLYRITPAKLKELKVQIQDLQDKGFIRPSISLWEAPILFVKKDRSMKFCINYMQLNKATVRNKLIPIISHRRPIRSIANGSMFFKDQPRVGLSPTTY